MQTDYHSLVTKHVFITGGASGIGEALVRAFHRQGSKVSFIDISKDLGTSLAEELKTNVDFYCADIRDVEKLQQTIGQAIQNNGPISILVNNAARDTRFNVDEVNQQIWDDMQAVNLRHVFFASQAVRAGMKELGGGSIINFTSTSFVKRAPRLTVYGAAKAAIVGLTRTLSRDFGEDNIRVNAIMPGWVMTQRQKELWLTPEAAEDVMKSQSLKRFIEPEEVAKLALFLASDDSTMISAQSYVIDGGWI